MDEQQCCTSWNRCLVLATVLKIGPVMVDISHERIEYMQIICICIQATVCTYTYYSVSYQSRKLLTTKLWEGLSSK
jgi:hypothetical protein